MTAGSEEGGRKAMENLLQKDPGFPGLYHQRACGGGRL